MRNATRTTEHAKRFLTATGSARGGFTLLELLLALALTLVVAAAMAAAMYTAFRARTSAMDAVESVRETSMVGDMIAREIGESLAPTAPALNAGTIQGLSGANTTGALVGPFEGLTDTVDFFVTGPEPKAGLQGDVREVVYLLEADPSSKNNGQVLARRVTTNLLASTKTAEPDEVISRNVTAIHFSYFDGTDWVEAWDSTAMTGTLLNCVPMAVEIDIDFAPAKKGGDVRHTTRFVPLATFKPQTQTTPTVTSSSSGTVTGL